MQVIELNSSHRDLVQQAFSGDRLMGAKLDDAHWADINNALLYARFADTYLADLQSFHAAAAVSDDGGLGTIIAYYQAADEPAWYYTLCRGSGSRLEHQMVLDHIISTNEKSGRLRFYTLINARYRDSARRFGWSEHNAERYGYIDEYLVPAKTKCFYTTHWDLLFKKSLVPEDSIVRCSFLKQEYRDQLPRGGSL